MEAVENRIWRHQYPVRFFHVSEERFVHPSFLCDFMQDSAVNHIEALGHSLDMLQLKEVDIELKEITFIELNYNSQSFAGDNLILLCRMDSDGEKERICHQSIIRENDGAIICNARFRIAC